MHIIDGICYNCITVLITSLRMASRGGTEKEEHHRIAKVYLWVHVQLVGLKTPYHNRNLLYWSDELKEKFLQKPKTEKELAGLPKEQSVKILLLWEIKCPTAIWLNGTGLCLNCNPLRRRRKNVRPHKSLELFQRPNNFNLVTQILKPRV